MNCLTSCFSCFRTPTINPGSAPGSSVEPTVLERKVATTQSSIPVPVLDERAEEMPSQALKTLRSSLASSTASEGLAQPEQQALELIQKVSESSKAVLIAPPSISGSINGPLALSFSHSFSLPNPSSLPILRIASNPINHEDLVVNIQLPLVPVTPSLCERKVAAATFRSQEDSAHPYRVTTPSSNPVLDRGVEVEAMLPIHAFRRPVPSFSQLFPLSHPSSQPILGTTSVSINQDLVITIDPPSSSQMPSLPSSSSLIPIIIPTTTVLPPNNPIVNEAPPSPQTPPPSIGFVARSTSIRQRGEAQESSNSNESILALNLLRAGFVGETEQVRMSSWHE